MSTETLLFADQVSSTAQLTALGDARTQDIRSQFLGLLDDIVLAFDGRSIGSTGDGVFAAFNGARNAVDAAVELQQHLDALNRRVPPPEQVLARVGIHTGDPLVGQEGADLFGAAVVVARRLCDKAGAREILVSSLTRALVEPHGLHRFADVGPLELKGIPEPTPAARLLWDAEPTEELRLPEALDRREPLLGREEELVWLQDSLDDAIESRTRSLLLIEGAAGAGKTALAAAFAHHAAVQGAAVLYGRASGPAHRLSPWIDALNSWASRLSRAQLRLEAGPAAPDLAYFVPAMAERLPPRPSSTDAAPEVEVFRFCDALDRLLRRLARQAPVLIVLDDMDDTDDSSLLVLDRLIGSAVHGPVLVVAVAAQVPGADESGAQRTRRLRNRATGHVLAGLDLGGVAALLEATSGEAQAAEVVERVGADTLGLPGLVRRVGFRLREQQLGRTVSEAAMRAEEVYASLREARAELTFGLRELDELRDTEAVAAATDRTGSHDETIECPYQGLAPYEATDAERFHGREQLVVELLARLAAARFVAVVGASGAGKSSLVRAGLLPALRRGDLPGSEAWRAVVMAPGSRPVDAFVEAVSGLPTGSGEPTASRLVLVVDQAEELFTSASAADRQRFLDMITAAVDGADSTMLVVLVTRSDFYGRMLEHPGLARLMPDSQVVAGPMTADELCRAIERPALMAGLQLEPGLTQTIIDDAADQPGFLPLVSTALQETFERRRGRLLTLAGYAEAGGVRRAVARLAEDTWSQLDDEGRVAFRRIVGRLAAPDEHGHDLRRVANIGEVAPDATAARVLALLVERRLVIVDGDDVEVAHEALLREWPRLREWLDADRRARRFQHGLAAAAKAWADAGREPEMLLRGPRLAAALDSAAALEADASGSRDALSPLERTYLAESEAVAGSELRDARRTARRLRVLLGAAGIGIVLALVAGVVALLERQQAVAQAKESFIRGVMSESQALGSTDREAALLLAVEAADRVDRVDTASNLLAALQRDSALLGYIRQPAGASRFTAVAALPDSRIALGDGDGRLHVLDIPSRRPVTSALELAGPISSVAVDPSGQMLAVGLTSEVLVGAVDDVVRGRADSLKALALQGAPVRMAWRADGAVLAVQERSRTSLWDVHADREVKVWEGSNTAVAFSSTGLLAVSESDGVRLWDADTFQPVGAPQAIVPPATVLAFTPDGRELVSVEIDGRPALRSVPELTEVSKAPRALLCSRIVVDGRTAWCAGTVTRRVDAYDIATWIPSSGYDVQEGSVDFALTGSEERKTLVVASSDSPAAGMWSVFGRGALAELIAQPGATPLGYQPGGRLLLTADESYQVWDSDTLEPGGANQPRPRGFPASPGTAEVARDGRVFGLLADDQVGSYDPATGQGTTILLPLPGHPVAVSLDDTGTQLAVELQGGDTDRGQLVVANRLVVVDVATGSLVADHGQGPRRLLGYGRDGALLVQGDDGGVVDLVSGSVVAPARPGVRAFSLSPDRRLLAEGGDDGTVTVRELPSGAPVGPGFRASSAVVALAMSEDRSLVAIGVSKRNVELFDMTTGERVGSPIPVANSMSVALRPDGKQLAVSGARGVEVWTLDHMAWRDAACQRAGRNLTPSEWEGYLPGVPYRSTCASWPSG